MWSQRLMWIAWPAFLMAGVLEMLVFAMVDRRTCTGSASRWRCHGKGSTPWPFLRSGLSPWPAVR